MNLRFRTLEGSNPMHRQPTDIRSKPPELGPCTHSDTVILGGRIVALRIDDFFDDRTAHALANCLGHLAYERDEIAAQKRVNRAMRHGDLPDDPLIHSENAPGHRHALEALSIFESPWLLNELERTLGISLRVLRPATPYRMDVADYIEPHDDHPAPEYRLSLACNLTRDWKIGDGGETVVGLVDTVTEFDDPEFFFPLKRWTLQPEQRVLTPVFNSVLALPLSPDHAHAVRPVLRSSRFSITTLYGHDEAT
ncbi:2OG-Fe(II) oxygenase [Nocardia seriolae]|uniref:2OG-Fe(II) oxygenase n=1 Tax=Nocardia seriolae TaxID=37332 RepID=UPI0012BD728B|nr:2OG-Fe(II) oxygenase [Nocardia seriolae]